MILLKSVILLTCLGLAYPVEWSYDYETQWPRKCRDGTSQSPINIMTRDAVVDKHGVHIRGPLVFAGYDTVEMKARNNGHTLQWSVSGDAPRLSGGPLRGSYDLLQFHLHWLSEHAVDGMKYPLEIHLVHVRSGLSVEEALQRPDGLAVVGVLCEVYGDDAKSSFALEQLMSAVPELFNTTSEPVEVDPVNVSRMISPRPQSFYTYHGSLTTPSCDEVVTWIVMDTPLTISDTQFKTLSRVNVGGINNYRSLQRSNRVVYRSASSGAALRPAAPALLLAAAGLAASLSTSLAAGAASLSTSLAAGAAHTACKLLAVKRKLFGESVRACEAKLK